MKLLKKVILNFIYCRMSRSTIIIFVILIFVLVNFFFLQPFKSVEKGEDAEKVEEESLLIPSPLSNSFPSFIPMSWKGITVNNANREDNIDLHRHPPSILPQPKAITTSFRNNVKTTAKQQHIPIMAVLVISCNRPAVKRCLDRLLQYKPKDVNMPVIVSQDCGHGPTADVIQSYGDKVTHIRQPNLGDVEGVPHNMMQWMGYYKISRHYKWALGQVFARPNIDSVVIVEDDLDISPDFFEYFLATRSLLDEDPSLFCVSAWNDNGKADRIDGNAIDILYRTDFFPGLGWLLTRKVWEEFAPKWPLGFWDDWVRAPEQRKRRSCIRPEISRTRTFGRVGVSLGQFYDSFLQFIKLNDKPYPFREYDLNHLLKKNYDRKFLDIVYNTPERRSEDEEGRSEDESIRITYNNKYDFERTARRFEIMTDLKAGVPRTAYKGVVTIYKNKRRIYIAPPKTWNGYDES